MQDNPLISVVVPIYNVQNYLSRCVDSILGQTYNNLEIILVNDGSPDGCPAICDEYAKKDGRVKVVHKANGGLSDARNAGMEIATGEYIGFIDSDDYVSQDFFEELLNAMISYDCDIVECSSVKFYEDGRFEEYSDDNAVVCYSPTEGLSELFSETVFHQHVWNKLYKSEIALDIPYAVGKLNEDEFWTYQVFGRAKKTAKLNKTLYYYFQRSGSIMGAGYNLRRLDSLEGKAERQSYIEQYYPQLALQTKIDMYASCIFAYQSVLKFMSGSDKKKAAEIIKKYKKFCSLSFGEIKTVKGGFKKYFYLAKFSFYLCCKLKAILNIGF